MKERSIKTQTRKETYRQRTNGWMSKNDKEYVWRQKQRRLGGSESSRRTVANEKWARRMGGVEASVGVGADRARRRERKHHGIDSGNARQWICAASELRRGHHVWLTPRRRTYT